MSRARPHDRRLHAAAAFLLLAVASVYLQVRNHQFLNYDDDLYLTANPLLAGGLTWEAVAGAFAVRAANWHPLTWLSHLVDWQLFGAWAGGHLLENAALHGLNAVLLLRLLASATGRFWPAAAVAAVFALHPLRVESVAWAAERKDVLAGLLWLLTTGAYIGYVRRPATRRLLAVHALFALGLMAKPVLVTLPLVLLLLDWWPLGRVAAGGTRAAAGGRSWWPHLREKGGLFALSLAACAVTLHAQGASVVPHVLPSLAARLANALVSCAAYLRDLAWPGELAFLYPYPQEGTPPAAAGAAALLLTALTVAALRARRRHPWLTVGWLWYLVSLVPMSGLVQVGAAARSDRYTYLTLLGVTIALAWEASSVPLRRRTAAALSLAGAVWLAWLAWSAHGYVGAWKDSVTLMSTAVARTRDNYVALDNLGVALKDAGRVEESLPFLREAVRIRPDHCNAQYNLGAHLLALGRHREAHGPLTAALACYRRVGARRDYLLDTERYLGEVCIGMGRAAEAERHYRAALEIAPHDSEALAGLAWARAALRQPGSPPAREAGSRHGP